MYGVIRHPRATFNTIAQTPSWGPVLLVTTTITFLCSIGFLSTDVGRQALVDQWERTATAFGQPLDDDGYARMEEAADGRRVQVLYAAATAIANGPALAIALSSLLFVVLRPRSTGDRPSYFQVLAVASFAGTILALRQVVATPIDYVRESIASPTTLVQFFGMLDEASGLARFLGVIDLFIV